MTLHRLERLTWALQTDSEFRALGWSRGQFLSRFYRGRLRDHLRSRDVPLIESCVVLHRLTGRTSTLQLRLGPALGDWLVLRGVWLHQDYYHPRLANTRTMLDAGANIGMTAIWFRNWIPNLEVACVEPDPRNLPLLRANLAQNGIPSNVFACAVAPRAGHMRLGYGIDTGWSSLEGVGLHPHSRFVDVETRRIPDILDALGWARVDLLKLDVEGVERDLFADARDWIGRVGQIVFELHTNTSSEEIGMLLQPFGWRLEQIGREVEATYLATPADGEVRA